MAVSISRTVRVLAGVALSGSAVFLGCAPGDAASGGRPTLTRLEVIDVESPTYEGRSFGDVGTYEVIYATAWFTLDPADRRNALITDIDKAPRNADGMVEFSTDVHIIKPVDMSRANGRMFYEVVNRGNKGGFNGVGDNDPSLSAAAGDGLLMRQGYAMVWSGWEDERLRPRGDHGVVATLPVARNADGSSIVGETIFETIFDDTTDSTFTLPFYKAASLEQPQARMLVRNHTKWVGGPLVERAEVPRSAWSFVDESTVKINRRDPFLAPYDAGAAFELIYQAKDPTVLALGHAATRDLVEFLRHDTSEANPLRGAIQYAISTGNSQSGRYLKDFLYWGFNEDSQGRKVFEGMMPVVSGAHGMPLNERWGDADATGRSYERELTSKLEFPFTYGVQTDAVTGFTDGLLARCQTSDTCPNVIHVDGANEVFLKGHGLLTTDGLGNDIELPPNVRVYQVASVQHGPAQAARPTATCQQLTNPNQSRPHLRALLLALDAWSTAGTLPPASRHARVGDGTLVPSLPQAGMGFPEIPGVRYTGWHVNVAVKDKTSLPNRFIEGKEYTVLVPKTDADGNDLAGIRTVEVQVPIGTYTGWALRRAPFAEGEDCALTGQFIPFARTGAERAANRDPRLSIEERYASHAEYVTKVGEAADRLVSEGIMLQEDAESIKQAAAASDVRR
ncbi:MAG: hypothetical protein EXR91_00090 [Gemmatimonadetes bacterium]|nr:hypothetical protein [Gemmatimonadota bacterium]